MHYLFVFFFLFYSPISFIFEIRNKSINLECFNFPNRLSVFINLPMYFIKFPGKARIFKGEKKEKGILKFSFLCFVSDLFFSKTQSDFILIISYKKCLAK